MVDRAAIAKRPGRFPTQSLIGTNSGSLPRNGRNSGSLPRNGRGVRGSVPWVLIECPATGQFIATGVETDSDSFQLLSDIQPPVKCPLCGKRHSWTKRDATSVNPDRWSEDPDAEKCLIKAVKNAEQAAAVKSPEDREFHLRMERKWLGLAAGYQLIANVNRRHRSAVA